MILGFCAAIAGAATIATVSTVARHRIPARANRKISTPSVSAAGALVASLHPHLADRFGTIPTDQRFGIERAPEQYHIHDGVINPAAAHAFEKEERERIGKKFKALGPEQLPTPEETALITQLRDKGFDLQVFTVGRPEAEYTRIRGPVGDLQNWPGDAVMADVERAGKEANDAAKPDQVTMTGKDGSTFQARAIRLNLDRCQKCHEGVNVGDKVGSIVYRYWPRKVAKTQDRGTTL